MGLFGYHIYWQRDEICKYLQRRYILSLSIFGVINIDLQDNYNTILKRKVLNYKLKQSCEAIIVHCFWNKMKTYSWESKFFKIIKKKYFAEDDLHHNQLIQMSKIQYKCLMEWKKIGKTNKQQNIQFILIGFNKSSLPIWRKQ